MDFCIGKALSLPDRHEDKVMANRSTNMQSDVLTMNMEHELKMLAQQKFGKLPEDCSDAEFYHVIVAYCSRLLAVSEKNTGEKRVYLISGHFPMGRLLANNLINLRIYDRMCALLGKYGRELTSIEDTECEPFYIGTEDAGTAVSMMDSIAALGLPGEGIGLFDSACCERPGKHAPQNGSGQEEPFAEKEKWAEEKDVHFEIHYGRKKIQSAMYEIDAVGYDNGINRLRLFDPSLLPEDMRDSDLCRYYYLASNAAQWILREMKTKQYDLRNFFDHAVIQICSPKDSLIIPELVRILTEDKGLAMGEAAGIIARTCVYADRRCEGEAMPAWSVKEMEKALPRLMPVIRFLAGNCEKEPGSGAEPFIGEDGLLYPDRLGRAFCLKVTGPLPSESAKHIQIPDGVTFRRWLLSCNHELANFLSERISDAYKKDPAKLERLLDYQEDDDVLIRLLGIKRIGKERLASRLMKMEGLVTDPKAVFDMQLKRFDASQRQLLFALYILHLVAVIRKGGTLKRPVTFFACNNAGAGEVYDQDTEMLFAAIRDMILGDQALSAQLQLIMMPACSVTQEEKLIPACDISEEIAIPGRSISYMSGKKCMLNGAVTVCTGNLFGNQVRELTGEDHAYTFGMENPGKDAGGQEKDLRSVYEECEEVREAVELLLRLPVRDAEAGSALQRMADRLLTEDPFCVLRDLPEYIRVKDRMLEDYEDRKGWAKKILTGIAKAGCFSSDRMVKQYNSEIWKVG